MYQESEVLAEEELDPDDEGFDPAEQEEHRRLKNLEVQLALTFDSNYNNCARDVRADLGAPKLAELENLLI